jgi:hypothetical protein
MNKEYLKGSYRLNDSRCEGWIYIHIEGEPFIRGYQHGYWAAGEIADMLTTYKYVTFWNTGKTWDFFVGKAEELFLSYMDDEFLDEINGIAAGARDNGTDVTWQEILTLNGYEELTDYWWPNEKEGKYAGGDRTEKDHCSAFLATGSVTEGGKVVMAHNSWDEFVTGQYQNLVLDIVPTNGHRIIMQCAPGFIDSLTDFFITDAGIMGTETTMGGFSLYDPNEVPEFLRVRKAMQYANNLDEFVMRMLKKNNGGYANSWLLADVHTREIMRFELGLQYYHVERKKDGYFIGFNAPLDPRIRNLECSNTGYADIRRHQGARQVRLTQLMEAPEHMGKIDVEIGKKILADHYDVFLQIPDNPCSRTVDGHYELDRRDFMCQPGRPLPYQPRGAVDGKVMDSEMAGQMSFWALWGNSSGLAFDADKFLKEHIQWRHLEGYLKSRPSQKWTQFQAGQK